MPAISGSEDVSARSTITANTRRGARRNSEDLPHIKALRGDLVGARWALFKTTVFGLATVSAMAFFVNRSHLLAPVNPFVVNAGAAMGVLSASLATQSNAVAASARDHTRELASIAIHKAAALAPAKDVAKEVAQAAAPTRHARIHRAVAPAQVAAIAKPPLKHRHGTKLAAAPRCRVVVTKGKSLTDPPAIGLLMDIADHIVAGSHKAFDAMVDVTAALMSPSTLHTRAEGWMTNLRSNLNVASPESGFSLRDPSTMFSGAFNAGTAMGAAAAILFVILCMAMLVQVRDYLRGMGRRPHHA